MAFALAGGVDQVIAVKLAVQMQGFWILRGYVTEGRRLVKAALELPAVQAVAHAKAHALYVGAALAGCQSDHGEAQQMLEASMAIRRELGDQENIAATLSTLSMARLEAGDAKGAGRDGNEAIEIFRQLGDRFGELVGHCNMGLIALFEADLERARDQLSEGLALACELESPEIEGECELLLGEVDLERGDPKSAGEHFLRSLNVCRGGADTRGEANALWRLGAVDLLQGDLHNARVRLGDALKRFHSAEMWKELVGCLEDFAALIQQTGAQDAAVRLAAVATVTRKRMGLVRRPATDARWQSRLDALREPLGDERFVAIWTEGWDHWEVEDGIREALRATTASTESERGAAA